MTTIMRIDEPSTTLTDLLQAALALAFALSLARAWRSDGAAGYAWWAAAFAAVSAAAALGGASHGFGWALGPLGNAVLWRGALLSIGLAAFLVVGAAAATLIEPPWRAWLIGLAGLQLVAFAAWVGLAGHDAFVYAIADYGIALGIVLLLALPAARHGQPGAGWLVAGVAVSVAAALVQQRGPDLHRHLNHNDLYHLLQLVALYVLYRGALLSADGEPPQ